MHSAGHTHRLRGFRALKRPATVNRRSATNTATTTAGSRKFQHPPFSERDDMANTYTSLHFHIAFSTKNREPWITSDIELRIWEYLGGIARKNKMKPLRIGGIEDHVHLLIGAPPTLAPSKIAQLVKGGSSAWIHAEFPDLQHFAWQDGYGAFTVSKSNVPQIAAYIDNQREHHRGRGFQDEYREFMKRHDIDFDERHLWD